MYSIDWGGHFRAGKNNKPKKLPTDNLLIRIFLYEIKSLIKSAKSWTDLPESLFQCYECSEFLKFETDGKIIRCTNPCEYPNGTSPVIFELNIPSGKMVVANDLRKLFLVQGDYMSFGKKDRLQTTLAYAEAGMAHCYVGSSDPGVFRCASDKFIVGIVSGQNPRWSSNSKSKKVADIDTQLWWYSICDYDEFVRRTENIKFEKKIEIVKCEPGVYQFKHVHDEINNPDAQIYTFIKRIRKPDKLKNYSEKYNNLNITAEQVIFDMIKQYPDLYVVGKSDSIDTIQKAANTLLCCGGNGARYHPNGFWSFHPDLTNNSPAIDIPVFDEIYSWSSFSNSDVIAHIAGLEAPQWIIERYGPFGKVNDSFISLAFNICRCIIVHGITRDTNLDQSKQIKMAQECMIGLKSRFPDKIPNNCQ